MIEGREVLIIGAGSGVVNHRHALQHFIRKTKPFVIALNTQSNVDADLIDIRAACYPMRLLADCEKYKALPQPLVVPATRLQKWVVEALSSIKTLDFGLEVRSNVFQFNANSAVVPSSLVMAYVLAIATCGRATRILLAGFDGYGSDDIRTVEVENLLAAYQCADGALPIMSITPTKYKIATTSVYAI
jgi:4-hydroxy 2-oxovalerate aldolase